MLSDEELIKLGAGFAHQGFDQDVAVEFGRLVEQAVGKELHVEEWKTRRCECGAKDACAFAEERDRARHALKTAFKDAKKRLALVARNVLSKAHGGKGFADRVAEAILREELETVLGKKG